ncbi:hypothetical protein V6N13_064913 [Hibiscus sabdariffa]
MQEVGSDHAQSFGFSTDGFATTPTMRKLHLMGDRTSDVVEIETWCQSEGRIGTRRDWDAATGELIGRATGYGHAQDTCPVLLPAPVSAELVMEQAPANHPKVSHHTPTVITNHDDGVVGSFGPWMVATRRPRRTPRVQPHPQVNAPSLVQGSRFNPIHASDMDEEPAGNNVVPPKSSVPSSLHQSRKTTAPSHLKVAAKKKMILAGKMPKATPLRKPMTVNLSDFPILSKFSATASSSKSATTQGTLLDKTRHSVTTMNENADPNIVHSGSATNLAQDKSLILGDPPDVITGSDGPLGPSIMLKSASGDTLTKPARSNQHTDEGRVGCGDARFLPTAKQFLRDNKPDVVVFVEPRIRGRRADSVISSLGFPNSHRVEANGFASGIWVAWYDTVSITIAITHFQFVHFRITNKRDRSTLLATAVYASPSAAGKKFLWPHLCRLASAIRNPWAASLTFRTSLCTLLTLSHLRMRSIRH